MDTEAGEPAVLAWQPGPGHAREAEWQQHQEDGGLAVTRMLGKWHEDIQVKGAPLISCQTKHSNDFHKYMEESLYFTMEKSLKDILSIWKISLVELK